MTETFWGLVESAARTHPDRTVLTDNYGRTLTAGELWRAGLTTAAAFAADGIGPDTLVSWQLPTTLETMVVMVALARLGAVQNPILPIWRESELRFATAQLGVTHLVIPGVWRGYDHVAMAQAVSSNGLPRVLVIDHAEAPLPDELRLPAGSGVVARAADLSRRRPVGVLLLGYHCRAQGRSALRSVGDRGSSGVVGMVGASAADVYPIAFPISHIGGAAMLAAALRTGMTLALFDNFDPTTTPKAMAAQRPTLLGTATPFFVAYLAAQRQHGAEPLYPDLRGCLGGGAPLTPELCKQIRDELGVPGVANSWGLTEFPVATSPQTGADAAVLDYTVGPPVPGVRVRVVDEHGQDVPAGAEGELLLSGPQCFLGYVDAALDAAAFTDDGWFRSGDLGRIDTAGNVVVTGRLKDAIIRNAENISALEIENLLADHPGVDDVAVIRVPTRAPGSASAP